MSLNRLIAHAFQNVLVFGLMTQVFVQNLIISFYSLIWEQLTFCVKFTLVNVTVVLMWLIV